MKRELQILLLIILVCAGGLELVEVTTARYNITTSNHTIMKAGVFTKPGCPSQCGDLNVPYPFGINSKGNDCSISPFLEIICNKSTNPPKAFIPSYNYEVLDISDSELRIKNSLAVRCYGPSGVKNGSDSESFEIDGYPYVFSQANVFTVVGCDESASMYNNGDIKAPKGCTTTCSEAGEVDQNDCFGTGCCQVPVRAIKFVISFVSTFNNHTFVRSFNPCGYAFFGEKSSFKFRGASDLNDPTFIDRTQDTVPIVLDWAVEEGKNCTIAAPDTSSYACISANSFCVDVQSAGYRCSCEQGYEGNPYLNSGCKDIDECEDPSKNDCKENCVNIPGGYNCLCPHGYDGDGRENGTGCIALPDSQGIPVYLPIVDVKNKSNPQCPNKKLDFICKNSTNVVSSGLGAILLLMAIWWLYKAMQRRRIQKLKEKFFEKNGGLLLQQQFSSPQVTIETNKLFSSEELEKATNGYNEERILGQGGQGTVYKGMMTDGRIVAVKKSKIEDETKLEQFINEVVILSQTNHRNIVKLHGCCLETEVPLLVYEFIPNGTLSQYIHDHNEHFPLSWDVRVRIAAEVAGALFYLHSSASIPIYHRDVKSTNILLDHKYSAKVADFGTSKSISIDQTHMTTRVQGTFGYLDPEYFQSSQYTDKSDVYSFGVVLVELLTRQKPILLPSSNYEGRSLATLFMLAIKEDRLFDIIDAQVIEEDSREIMAFANLANRCLNLNGRKRPTMKEVLAELEQIRKQGAPAIEQQHDEVDNVHAELNGPRDYTSTSMTSSSVINTLSIDVEPLLYGK